VKKTLAILIPAVLAQAAGNVFLSMRMKEIGNSSWFSLLPRAVESPTVWLGTVLLMVSFILFASSLSWADLSFVIPAVSMEVAVNVVLANYFLHEVISLTRWAGVLFISLGVIMVMRSESQKAIRKKDNL
jgi:drug/metabolite transporter (DMT)-like permease